MSHRFSQLATFHAAFAQQARARLPVLKRFRGHLRVHLRYGPVTRSPSLRWLCQLASSASFPPRNATQATRSLTFIPVGLPPTEHASLRWTHTCRRWFRPHRCRAGAVPREGEVLPKRMLANQPTDPFADVFGN